MTLAHQAAPPLQRAVDLPDARSLSAAFGTLGSAAVMFAGTGLLIGFFLPGDSLLFAGLCASAAIALARYLPVVRTVLHPLADAHAVPARTLVLGGPARTVGLVLAGHGRPHGANGGA